MDWGKRGEPGNTAPKKGLDPQEPLKDDKLNKALDDLLNRLKDPNFLKEK